MTTGVMLDVSDKRMMLKAADLDVALFERKAGEAKAKLGKAQAEFNVRDEQLKRAIAHRTDLIGEFSEELEAASKSPYAGLNLREAALRIIKGMRGEPITFQEIIDTLASRDYEIESKYPSRSLHAALMRADSAERVAPGTYRWLNGAQDRSEEEGRGNAEQG